METPVETLVKRGEIVDARHSLDALGNCRHEAVWEQPESLALFAMPVFFLASLVEMKLPRCQVFFAYYPSHFDLIFNDFFDETAKS